ncbi:class I SAM-dependent methyltransferase [Novosphingobium colocasiae]|uniref:S-adenosylmethionine-dependent methyltransferase n=1 Tax=Novosphingobium colocasiae TaxID=1256513 RepID=A0A918UGG9_9SPHN|nr:class I SAM-dependent methyltransferase [Novosphingobium colocasiae]GGZ08406.1 S-adenosylmethionine-dependent methyltransferase [Novosphingobium colocasiae]
MGLRHWWDDKVVPRLIRCACGHPSVMKVRSQVVPLAEGRVFEIGCGGGINQRFYDPARVTAYCGLDPSAKGLDFAREAARVPDAQFVAGAGEQLPFPDDSFDTVVCTYTLCSVDDPGRTLAELRRVLKPGGALLYAEHGHAPDAGVARWQARIEPVWSSLAGNCHLTRPVTPAIAAAGFAPERMGAHYASGAPRFVSWMEWGRAVKPAV